jgi:PIN domain nuclease of toxin-antitoxin system
MGRDITVVRPQIQHKDPFDRLLISQALVEEAVLVSKDPIFPEYPVTVVW